MWTQSSVRLRLAPAAYREFLKPVTAHYEAHPDREYPWDPATGTCGEHSRFVAEALGVKRFYPEHFRVVPPTPAGRRRVMADLDAGFLVELYHDYIRTGPDMFPLLPKDNRVAGHRFMVGRSGGKYFVAQGFVGRYLSRLTFYPRPQLEAMLAAVMADVSDYGGDRLWGDARPSTYKRYFFTELTAYPASPLIPGRRMHRMVLHARRLRTE